MRTAEEEIAKLNEYYREYLGEYFKNAPKWLMEDFQVLTLPAQSTFIEEGEVADNIYILLKGRVIALDYRVVDIVYRHYDFHPIEVFGAMEIIGEIKNYMTSLMTLEECTFLKISSKKFESWLCNDLNAYRMQASRIERYLLKQVRKERLNLLLNGRERVAIVLMRLYDIYSNENAEAGNNGDEVCIRRKEFMEITGLSERSVTRILKEFEEKGLIIRSSRDILINFDRYLLIKDFVDEKIYE